jgi:hypothetical protein
MSPRFVFAPTRDRWSGRDDFMGLNGPAALNLFKGTTHAAAFFPPVEDRFSLSRHIGKNNASQDRPCSSRSLLRSVKPKRFQRATLPPRPSPEKEERLELKYIILF